MNKCFLGIFCLVFTSGGSVRHQTQQEIWLTKAGQILEKKVEKEIGKPLSKWSIEVKNLSGTKIGLCIWYPFSGYKIYISPKLTESNKVLTVMLHELIHVGILNPRHGPKFRLLAIKLGIEDEPTYSIASQTLINEFFEMLKILGPYPVSEE